MQPGAPGGSLLEVCGAGPALRRDDGEGSGTQGLATIAPGPISPELAQGKEGKWQVQAILGLVCGPRSSARAWCWCLRCVEEHGPRASRASGRTPSENQDPFSEEQRKEHRQWRPTGSANGLGRLGLAEFESLTSRKHQTHFLEKAPPGEPPTDSWAFSRSQAVLNPVPGLLWLPSVPSSPGPSPTPSGRPVTSTHAAQGADCVHGIQ